MQPLNRGALVTEDMIALIAPMLAGQKLFVQDTEGPMTLDVSTREGFIVLVLMANNTGITFLGATMPHLFLFMVVQGGNGGFTWTPPVSVGWAGGSPGPCATAPGHADIYTLSSADGTGWLESGRSLDVSPLPRGLARTVVEGS